MSAMGIPQITAIMGMCVAGGAYLSVMCDNILMTEGSGLFLAGPALVQSAIGQKSSAEEWAARRCTRKSAAPSTSASRTTKRASGASARWLKRWATGPGAPFDPGAAEPPAISRRRHLRHLFETILEPYDMREVIARIVDGSKFDEYKAEYGQTLMCGYARIGG